jgi:hypothetical protein
METISGGQDTFGGGHPLLLSATLILDLADYPGLRLDVCWRQPCCLLWLQIERDLGLLANTHPTHLVIWFWGLSV